MNCAFLKKVFTKNVPKSLKNNKFLKRVLHFYGVFCLIESRLGRSEESGCLFVEEMSRAVGCLYVCARSPLPPPCQRTQGRRFLPM